MVRVVLIALAVTIAAPEFAEAGESRFRGKYNLTQPGHRVKVKKVDGLTAKQKSAPAYNPKEFKLDEKVQQGKAPTSRTLCAPPGGGKPRAC